MPPAVPPALMGKRSNIAKFDTKSGVPIFVSRLVFAQIIPMVHFNAQRHVRNGCDIKSLTGSSIAPTRCYYVTCQIVCLRIKICVFIFYGDSK